LFNAVVDWVEQRKSPDTILASKVIDGGTRTRPLCPYPSVARWKGVGSTDDAASFVCVGNRHQFEHRYDEWGSDAD
jgi:feruloyl esterase